jgi:hypothetical protein
MATRTLSPICRVRHAAAGAGNAGRQTAHRLGVAEEASANRACFAGYYYFDEIEKSDDLSQ